MALISVSVDQFWWFLWLKSSIHTCWFVLWWPEPLAWPFRWVKLAWKRISSLLLYAPYTTVGHRPEDPLNVNQIEFFWHFRQKLVKLNQKMLEEQWKVKKLQSESPYPLYRSLLWLEWDKSHDMAIGSALLTFMGLGFTTIEETD